MRQDNSIFVELSLLTVPAAGILRRRLFRCLLDGRFPREDRFLFLEGVVVDVEASGSAFEEDAASAEEAGVSGCCVFWAEEVDFGKSLDAAKVLALFLER